jgi:hypothetical protein
MTKPTICQIVCYTLADHDAEEINRRRDDFTTATPTNTGFQGHVGNYAEAGDVLPAMIVRVFDPDGETGTCNLKVMLDGNDDYWATSRKFGDGPGEWHWPPRA